MIHRRVIKNTIMLYIRMIISVIISLYTSRIILEALGFEDYGIYNVVGGTVAIVGFLSATMSSSTSRFLTIALVKDSFENLQRVFNTASTLHLILAGIILLLGETIGLWFVNNILNLPSNQTLAINIVYQLSLFSICISIIQVPYNALIIAHEDMHAFAYLEILNSILKLVIAYVTLWINGHKLITYSILVFLIAIVMRLFYSHYAIKNYKECRVKLLLDKGYIKSLTSFSGWDLLGHIGFTARQQGTNILLNLFFGAVINAASGIATSVQGIVSSFSSNIVMATRPYIIKTYAKKENEEFQDLLCNVSVLSLLMVLAVTIPIVINIEPILSLWLKKVPPYCAQFTVLCLGSAIVSSISSVYLIGIHAIGEVKYSSLGRNITYIFSLFVLYAFLKQGFSPTSAYIILICTQVVTIINDSIILRKKFPFKLQYRLLGRIISLGLVGAVSGILALKISFFSSELLKVVTSTLIYLLLFLIISFLFVLNQI